MSDDSAPGTGSAGSESAVRVAADPPGAQVEDFLAQTARIPFAELQRYFAAGKLIRVQDTLDLISVAVALANDETAVFAQWLAGGQVATVSDEEATLWLGQEQLLWAVVVDPWVLVQERRVACVTG